MKIAISAESTVDLTKELLERYDIRILPFQILLGDNNYYDGEITTDDIKMCIRDRFLCLLKQTIFTAK